MQAMLLDLGASGNTGLFGSLESAVDFSVQVTVTDASGNPAGTFDVQATNENGIVGTPNVPATPVFGTVGPHSALVGDGATPSTVVAYHFPAGAYRLAYTRTGGSGKARVSVTFGRTR